MEGETKNNGLRCRPGDLARVIYSSNPLLLGRTVIVEGWNDDGRWNVHLLGEPSFGVALYSKRPMITSGFAAKDSSLEPITPLSSAVNQSTVDRLDCVSAA